VFSHAINADKSQKVQWDQLVNGERIMEISKAPKIPRADTICELPHTGCLRIIYHDNIKHDVRHVGLDYIYWNGAFIRQKCWTIDYLPLNWSCGACGHVVRYTSTNISEESTATIFRVELQEGGSRHLRNFGTCLLKHTASHNRRPVH